jgi:hypothetical protein
MILKCEKDGRQLMIDEEQQTHHSSLFQRDIIIGKYNISILTLKIHESESPVFA